MKRKLLWIMISLFLLTGCEGKKSEEAMAVTQEIYCNNTGAVFTFDGYWEVESVQEKEEYRSVELKAKHKETGANILIFHEQLEEIPSGELLRDEDYIEAVKEKLKIADEYSYSVGETTDTILYGKAYETFTAIVSELKAKQQYYIRRENNQLTVITITVYGPDSVREIISLGKKI